MAEHPFSTVVPEAFLGNLSVHESMLLLAHERSKTAPQTATDLRTLAAMARMSIGQASKCKQRLIALGLIPEPSTPSQYQPVHRGFRKHHIPETLRWEVWERDNFTCTRCGSRRFLSIDHVTPESFGGTTTIDNLQTLCLTCNHRKGRKQ